MESGNTSDGDFPEESVAGTQEFATTSPSTAGLYRDLSEELDRADTVVQPDPPPYVAGTIDIADFVKAQAQFLREQTSFLRMARRNNPEEYLERLTNYSLAQDDYIQAMSVVLHRLGVI